MKTIIPYILIAAAAFALAWFLKPVKTDDAAEERYRKEIQSQQEQNKALRAVLLRQAETSRQARKEDSLKFAISQNASNAAIQYWKKKAVVNLGNASVRELDSLRFKLLNR